MSPEIDDLEDYKTICAWCKKHIKGDEDAVRVSHGICPECYKLEFEEKKL